MLFPNSIATKIENEKIETLVFVSPFNLGIVPFAALPIAGRQLVDVASILVAPGFASLRLPQPDHATSYAWAIVIGDPKYPKDPLYDLPPLQGARAEAIDVAAVLHAKPILGDSANRAAVESASKMATGLGIIYLATHAFADPVNPFEGSAMWLSDGRWTGREIQALRLHGDPMVVLSACQTGLGKTFDVGIIGLALAWKHAGAGTIVMSLWRVDDTATAALMGRFMRESLSQAPDKALQTAMRALRQTDPDPAHWASFVVFGIPER